MKRIQVVSFALLAVTSVAANNVGRMDTTTFKLNEVVVSASKWKQNMREQPKRISTIKPEQFLFENPQTAADLDRKSTRLNSSHANISYAVFCLKKKKTRTMYTV